MKMKYKLIVLILVMIFGSAALAQSGLSKEVQADLKQQQILQALKSKKFEEANKLFEEYEELGVQIPPPLLLQNAQVNYQIKHYAKAKFILEEYLAVATRGSDGYKKALKMHAEVSPLAEPQLKQFEEEREEVEAEARAREIEEAVTGKWKEGGDYKITLDSDGYFGLVSIVDASTLSGTWEGYALPSSPGKYIEVQINKDSSFGIQWGEWSEIENDPNPIVTRLCIVKFKGSYNLILTCQGDHVYDLTRM